MADRATEENDRDRRRGILPWLILGALALVIIWVLFNFLSDRTTTDTGNVKVSDKTVTFVVPDVVGLSTRAARDRLESAGFVSEAVESSQAGTPDSVVAQSPKGGSTAEAGAKVVITVTPAQGETPVISATETETSLPSLIGRPEDSARARLEDLGYVVAIERVYANAPEGTVYSQSPAPGTIVPVGDTVTLTISRGNAPIVMVSMPDVIGLTESAARAKITAAGLVPYGMPWWTTTGGYGLVAHQFPAAGTSVPSGSQGSYQIARPK